MIHGVCMCYVLPFGEGEKERKGEIKMDKDFNLDLDYAIELALDLATDLWGVKRALEVEHEERASERFANALSNK